MTLQCLGHVCISQSLLRPPFILPTTESSPKAHSWPADGSYTRSPLNKTFLHGLWVCTGCGPASENSHYILRALKTRVLVYICASPKERGVTLGTRRAMHLPSIGRHKTSLRLSRRRPIGHLPQGKAGGHKLRALCTGLPWTLGRSVSSRRLQRPMSLQGPEDCTPSPWSAGRRDKWIQGPGWPHSAPVDFEILGKARENAVGCVGVARPD